jgi:hypothetical protein
VEGRKEGQTEEGREGRREDEWKEGRGNKEKH